MLTMMNQQMSSFRTLLADKADISIHNTYDGTSALIEACSNRDCNSRYAETLMELGANVNDVETGLRRKGNSTRHTPLIAAWSGSTTREENRDVYLVDLLRGDLVDLGTNEYPVL